jgi:hypothetical protein
MFVPLAVIAVVLGACGPGTPAMPRLEDPKEVVAEAIRTTAELEYVHARLELEAQAADPAGGVGNMTIGYVVDLDLDIVRREFHALVEGNLGFGGGVMRAELLVVGNESFTRTEGDASLGGPVGWRRTPMGPGSDPRDDLPPNDVIAAVLDGFLDDPGLELRLEGMEDCASGTCYHVTATVAPDLTWRVINGQIFDGPGAVDSPVDPSIPALTFDLLVDEGTRRLISLSTSTALIGAATTVRVMLSDHDREVRFVPPPPDQIQDVEEFAPGGGMDGGGVILEDVGNEVPVPS